MPNLGKRKCLPEVPCARAIREKQAETDKVEMQKLADNMMARHNEELNYVDSGKAVLDNMSTDNNQWWVSEQIRIFNEKHAEQWEEEEACFIDGITCGVENIDANAYEVYIDGTSFEDPAEGN